MITQGRAVRTAVGPMMKEMLSNRILSGLPDAEFARLVPLLEPVSLAAGEPLVRPGEAARFVYFPESAVVSCQADMQDGKSAEVGMIGKEGAVCLAVLLGQRPATQALNVTVAGSALRMRRDDFEQELRRGGALQQALFAHAGAYVAQVSQRAACAILHRLEQRLACWLLLLTDRVDTNAVEITHERIAQHLGVRRAGVTEVAGDLQYRGAISYSRGSLRVVDRRALEAIACECYSALTGALPQTTVT